MHVIRCLVLAGLAGSAAPAAAITIDGRIAPDEWDKAHHVTDFRQTEPLTGAPAQYPVQAWILATPKGLAVAVRVAQPPGVPRSEQRVQRDFHGGVDRVNVNLDFDAAGRTGYNFVVASTGAAGDAVITNERRFNDDWDGDWQHAVQRDAQGWSVEMLIPWYTAPMHQPDGGMRTIGVNIDRVIAGVGLRAAWPVVSYQRPRFLSEFARIEVPAYSQSLLVVTPYVSALYDNVGHAGSISKGADVFWKPNGQFQLTATLNPDFGQVESDDLVVNFSATETYYSDKRPFFTENQGLFAFSLLEEDSQLVYTRRVGGPADDGNGSSDIAAAAKVNGSLGTTSYGMLVAHERGDAGRDFGALRIVHDFGSQDLGMLLTRVDHPWLDSQATVLGIDHRWQPGPRLTISTSLVTSDIAQQDRHTRGSGATFRADYEMDGGWRQQWMAMHFDDRLQVNDFGYLDRNNMDYAHWQVSRRVTDLSDDSSYRSHDWRVRFDALDDDHGLRLRRQLRIVRESNLRDGADEALVLNLRSAAWDDLLTRGNGALFLPPSFRFRFGREYPRSSGDWAWEWEVELGSGGLSGNREVGYELEFAPTWFISDAFNVHAGVKYEHTPDWLVWQYDNLVGRFDQHSLQLDAGFDWSIDERQELRLKVQAIGLHAPLRDAWRVSTGGRALPSDDPVDDISVRNLGVQLRYRYQLAPLSYLYVVYGRGGYLQDDAYEDALGLLRDSFSLRDDDQLIIKLNYRFEL